MHQPDLQGGAGAVFIVLGPKGVYPVAYEAMSFPYRGTALQLSYETGNTEKRCNSATGLTYEWIIPILYLYLMSRHVLYHGCRCLPPDQRGVQ